MTDTIKIVINVCFGGFGLSAEALTLYAEKTGIHRDAVDTSELCRDDPDLVAVVEELGEAADGGCAKLKIVEVPKGVMCVIEEHDGVEHVAEVHRTWS